MRRDAEHAREQPQEMKRAEPGHARDAREIHRLMRVGVQPQRRFDRAAAIGRVCLGGAEGPAPGDLDESL